MGVVIFNGTSSETLGLIVQFIPPYEFPEREYQAVNIPGRNGDLVLDKGSYRNVERTYSFAKIFQNGEKFHEQATKIVAWLSSAKGYARLEDTYELDENGHPKYYRMAYFNNPGALSNFYDVATVLDVTFVCKPERWLTKGEDFVTKTSGQSITNPTDYDANPIITMDITNSNQATVTIGTKEITIGPFTGATSQNPISITIDCENKECYSGNTLYNSKLTLTNGTFPVLPGNETTTITFSNNVTNFKIQPRWWTL